MPGNRARSSAACVVTGHPWALLNVLMPFFRHQARTVLRCLAPLKAFRYSASPIIPGSTDSTSVGFQAS